MAGQPTPPLVQQAFAKNAAPGFIQFPIPVTTANPGRASYDLGFPPQTMQEIFAGGTPPFGQDFNGLMFTLSSHVAALQAGQPYLYDSALSTAMGGYAVGAVLGMADSTGLWINTVNGNVTDPDGGAAAGWMPLFSRGFASVSGLTGGVVVLTPAQYRRGVIVLAGALAGNLQVVVPNGAIGQRSWLIVNTTTGAFTTTVKTAAGTGVAIPAGGFSGPTEVYGDGTNIYPTVAPLSVPIDQNPTNLTLAQRTNTGALFATYFNQNSGLENFSMAAVYADAGDGYHRKISLANFAAQIALSQFAGQVVAGQVPAAAVTQYAAVLFANAALTGTPTAPTAAVGTNTTQIASTAFVQAAAFGTGAQSWVDLSASRFMATLYTNSTGRPIMVNIICDLRRVSSGGGSVTLNIDGVNVARCEASGSTDAISTISAIVQPGKSYQAIQVATLDGYQWNELR